MAIRNHNVSVDTPYVYSVVSSFGAASCVSESASYDSCVLIIWNPAQGEHICALQFGVYEIMNIARSPIGYFIAAALTNGDVFLYNPDTENRDKILRTPIGFTVMACSPDGIRLAAGSEDGSVLVWDLH